MSARYRDMAEACAALFPDHGSPALALTFRDQEGDLVTVTSRADLRSALAAAASTAEREVRRCRLNTSG